LPLVCGWHFQQQLLFCQCCRLLTLTGQMLQLLLPAAALAAACRFGWLLCSLEASFLQVLQQYNDEAGSFGAGKPSIIMLYAQKVWEHETVLHGLLLTFLRQKAGLSIQSTTTAHSSHGVSHPYCYSNLTCVAFCLFGCC
jgi:hypothetical protein